MPASRWVSIALAVRVFDAINHPSSQTIGMLAFLAALAASMAVRRG